MSPSQVTSVHACTAAPYGRIASAAARFNVVIDRTAAICSFAIPLITIVATFVFKLFLPILVVLFNLWFLLKLRFCIPPSVELGGDVDAALDVSGIVSFNIDQMECRDVAMILDQSFDIQCRAGLHCAPLAHQTLGTIERGGTVRFSPGVFTREEEIDAAIAAVRTIANAT